MSWFMGPLCGFDLETTGVDPQTDRIVTACVVACGTGVDTAPRSWLANPGVAIPDEAASVHGITTERARAEGRPAADVVAEIVDELAEAAEEGVPIVAMNASFDLTMLEREAERYGVRTLFARSVPMVVDPRVLDKRVDPYRRGGRTLTDLCRTYRVPLDAAHDAGADAIAACRVAWRIGSRYPAIGNADLGELHEQQAGWAREQAESLADYFRRTPGKESWADGVRTEWPLVPAQRTGGDAS